MNTALRVIRILCVIVFVGGIAGLIISSIAGNNVGVVTTIGLITSLAAIVLLTASTVANRQRIDAFNDALAEQVEGQIGALVASGAKEDTLRRLVRDAINLGRSAS
jgi:c-di-AMP phosphodiesterase-like protein